jgi:hypothetical protein
LYDAQRGVQNRLESNTTDAAVSSDNGVTAFNADGFSIGSLAQVNTNGATYVAWCWKEGPTQGFDIVLDTTPSSFTNRAVSHSLGVSPSMIIAFLRNAAGDTHLVWHRSLATTEYLQLQTTAAKATNSAVYNGVSSTTFTLGSNTAWGAGNYVFYLFAAVAGFSRIGSYTGNGSTDGPFVFCGFRPRWIMIKNIQDSTTSWSIWDTSRSPFNLGDQRLEANSSAAESSLAQFDILSNGFKLRSSNSNNASGQTIIFAAFAEAPFKNSLAR